MTSSVVSPRVGFRFASRCRVKWTACPPIGFSVSSRSNFGNAHRDRDRDDRTDRDSALVAHVGQKLLQLRELRLERHSPVAAVELRRVEEEHEAVHADGVLAKVGEVDLVVEELPGVVEEVHERGIVPGRVVCLERGS